MLLVRLRGWGGGFQIFNIQYVIIFTAHLNSGHLNYIQLATFQVLKSYTRLAATILDNSSLGGRVCVT